MVAPRWADSFARVITTQGTLLHCELTCGQTDIPTKYKRLQKLFLTAHESIGFAKAWTIRTLSYKKGNLTDAQLQKHYGIAKATTMVSMHHHIRSEYLYGMQLHEIPITNKSLLSLEEASLLSGSRSLHTALQSGPIRSSPDSKKAIFCSETHHKFSC